MTLHVIYEDNHILVVFKEAGLLTQPSGTAQASLENICKEYIKQKYAKPGNVYLHAVHRLDKPVSGIVLFAKTSKALSRLNEAMREKESSKTYLALIEGELPVKEGTLEHYLVHDEHHAAVAFKEDRGAKPARLHYKVIKGLGAQELIEIKLETGRYHQIRAQLAAAGHPIIGDQRYGSNTILKSGCIALQHQRLVLKHPVTGKEITFEAPTPSWA